MYVTPDMSHGYYYYQGEKKNKGERLCMGWKKQTKSNKPNKTKIEMHNTTHEQQFRNGVKYHEPQPK